MTVTNKNSFFPYFPLQSRKTSSSLPLHLCWTVLACFMVISVWIYVALTAMKRGEEALNASSLQFLSILKRFIASSLQFLSQLTYLLGYLYLMSRPSRSLWEPDGHQFIRMGRPLDVVSICLSPCPRSIILGILLAFSTFLSFS